MGNSLSKNRENNNNKNAAGDSFSDVLSRFGERLYANTLDRARLAIERIANSRKAKRMVANGLSLLENKLYKRASVEFQMAMDLNEVVTMRLLEDEFKGMSLQSDAERALSVGLVLLQKRDQDFELANRLGNYARKMQDYQQANDLYRKALRIKKSFVKAFYNLAASMGRVAKYDFDVKGAIDNNIASSDFILPEYQNDPKRVETVVKELTDKRQAEKDSRIQKLMEERDKMEAERNKKEVERIVKTIKRLEKIPAEPNYEEVCTNLRQIIDESHKKQSTPEDVANYHGNIFNLGLYAYYEKNPEDALECFLDLKSQDSKNEHLNMMIALIEDLKGDPQEARKQMFELLSKDRYNRYLNVNLGLLYRKIGNRLMEYRYLAVGASLLERSEGLYRIPDMIDLAEKKLEEGKTNKALKLYKIIGSETNNENAWLRIGEIYLGQEKYTDAIDAFQEVLKIDSESEQANAKLLEIHDMYCQRAEEVFQARRFSQAAALYERALVAVRATATIEQAISVYRQLHKPGKIEELTGELDKILEQEKEAEQEALRKKYIAKGKFFMKKKAYDMAVNSLEKAFRMKVDKDVFMSLAHLYKGMNRTLEFKTLVHRWQKMNKFEDEKKRQKKDKEREAKTVGNGESKEDAFV
ncbi:MAG: tetratricopeptide repeat protein [Proteobacteria bacterium]|nr:tetratricopeptide repeat protein [Pseudomonadota bacterium]